MRVAITGLGAVTPLGLDVGSTWQALLAGQSGVSEITLFDAATYPVRIGAEVRDFSLEKFLPDRRLRRLLNRGAGFGVAASLMAMADAGLQAGSIDPSRLGISFATGPGRPEIAEIAQYQRWLQSPEEAKAPASDPIRAVQTGYLAAPAVVARHFQAQGPHCCVHMASASSAHSIGLAQRAIKDGDATVMIAGGFDAAITPGDLLGLARGGLLSSRNAEPARASRPFDRDRDGFVLGEGGVMVVLEELDHARKRGARIYAELAGYGSTLSAFRIADAPPDGKAYAKAMELAMEDAKVNATDIDYIQAYANSTKDVDKREVLAIKDLFGDQAYQIPVSSTKSMTGHLTLASGAAGLVFTTLALRDGMLPPTINYENPDPQCDLDCVPNRARSAKIDVAITNAYGLGGTNASLLVKRIPEADS